jgi:hypothetical protein
MYPRPPVPWPPARLPRAPIVATLALTLLVTGLGLLPWPRPVLSHTSVWMVSDVPGALWALVLGLTAVCAGTAAVLTVRAVGTQHREPALLGWAALMLVTSGALVWNALYAAALSTTSFGAIIPIFHWLFTFGPAVLAGGLFTRRGRRARLAAALGTGVVTVPLFQLFAVLLLPGDPVLTLLGSLTLTAVLAVAPFVGAVAIAGALGDREPGNGLPHPRTG